MTTSNSPVDIYIEFFGAFRNYGEGLDLRLTSGVNAEQIKQELETILGTGYQDLIAQSVLADEEQILCRDWHLTKPTRLAILPPVSGG